ncbi:MAG: FkbM family methyltransferase [Candidatus Paceibacterota bacterium]|jgi:FkbM family methyltransferase
MHIEKYLKIQNYIDYFKYLQNRRYRRSYAQVGEDLIIDYACKELGIGKPSYLDIGAYDPTYSNNTYFFYLAGGHGVCIEPNPDMFRLIQKKRSKDIGLNVGISPVANTSADYYVMTSPFLNTFSKEEADETVANKELKTKQKIEKVLHIPLVTINSIMETYFPHGVDILSVDTESYDLDILRSLDFKRFRPKIICVETLRYDANGDLQKSPNINDYLIAQGYSLYADTRVNSIFVEREL